MKLFEVVYKAYCEVEGVFHGVVIVAAENEEDVPNVISSYLGAAKLLEEQIVSETDLSTPSVSFGLIVPASIYDFATTDDSDSCSIADEINANELAIQANETYSEYLDRVMEAVVFHAPAGTSVEVTCKKLYE